MTGEPTEPTQSPETTSAPSPAILAGLGRRSTLLEDIDARAESPDPDPSEYITLVLAVIESHGFFRVNAIARKLGLNSHQQTTLEATLLQLASEDRVIDLGYGDYISKTRLTQEPLHTEIEVTIIHYLEQHPHGCTLRSIYDSVFGEDITDSSLEQRIAVLVSLFRLMQAERIARETVATSSRKDVLLYRTTTRTSSK